MVYREQGKPNTAAKIMLLSLLSFFQVLYSLTKLPLQWPSTLKFVIDGVAFFSIPGFVDRVEFKHECILGTSFAMRIFRDAMLPVFPWANFAILGLVGRAVGRPLHLPYVLNTVATFYSGIFVAISIMSVQLFPAEEMPNGKLYLKHSEGVEKGSREWWLAVPISLPAVLVYCCGFLAYNLTAVIQAPRRAAKEKLFMQQYDFVVADLRPETWWWSSVKLFYAFGVALIQTLSADVYVQIYVSMLFFLVMTLVEIIAKPSLFLEVNKVNADLGEIGGVFVSKQPSDTDMGAKAPRTILLKGIFYGKVV